MAVKSLRDNAGVDLSEIIAIRDTMHTWPDKDTGRVLVDFVSTLYYDTDGTLCVLRLIGDYTASQPENGGRDWCWRFYDSYTHELSTAPKRMEVSDLADLSCIMAYNKDRWVSLPWWDAPTKTETPSPGYLQTMQDIDLYRFVYKANRSWKEGTAPMNMYREPIVVFAVKRVKDDGSEIIFFDDGTPFQRVHLMTDDNPDLFDEAYLSGVTWDVYDQYHHQMFLNDKLYEWGMNNAK